MAYDTWGGAWGDSWGTSWYAEAEPPARRPRAFDPSGDMALFDDDRTQIDPSSDMELFD